MSDVVRWDLDFCDGESGWCRAEMSVTDNGDYVLWEDHAKEVAELKQEVAALQLRLQEEIEDNDT